MKRDSSGRVTEVVCMMCAGGGVVYPTTWTSTAMPPPQRCYTCGGTGVRAVEGVAASDDVLQRLWEGDSR